MRYVYTKPTGLEIRIDNWGTATNTTPAVVPDEVGAELAGNEALRIEQGRDEWRSEAVVMVGPEAASHEHEAVIPVAAGVHLTDEDK